MNPIDNSYFKSPVLGVDPISKGTFRIMWAYVGYDLLYEEDSLDTSQVRGEIVIEHENNPLYRIANEEPLRLQGLIGSVDFGIEKRFIKIKSIAEYIKEDECIILSPVTFEILDNLEYLESIDDYRCDNLL